jgi:hypothetical protein
MTALLLLGTAIFGLTLFLLRKRKSARGIGRVIARGATIVSEFRGLGPTENAGSNKE